MCYGTCETNASGEVVRGMICPGTVAIKCDKCGRLSCWWCGGHASPRKEPAPRFPAAPKAEGRD